ncbi:MAG: phenylalanine--tRNA ligase subunit beta [bacterium]
MKISFNILNRLLAINDKTPEMIVNQLNSIGREVASIEQKKYFIDEKIVCVQVNEVKPHPSADRLKLCVVNDGKANYNIVCGAPNVFQGMLAALAKEGAKLHSGMVISKAKIRGVYSEGMLCSATELGLWEDLAGILELEKSIPLGKLIKTEIPESDSIIDIELTPNRPDCMSHIGIARELACDYKLPLKYPEIFKNVSKSKLRKIFIDNPQICSRYYGVLLDDVKVGPAPLWMRLHIQNCGIRSINNIVDITNYVLIELGHPLHAFDRKNIEGDEIYIRNAKVKEEITTLDEKVYKLTPEDLIIADKKKPIAIAGIMGGEYSSISKSTSSIILESAYFDPISIRRTSKRLELSSESSIRFERGTDIENVYFSSRRAVFLMSQYADARVAAFEDHYPDRSENKVIDLRHKRVEKILGKEFEKSQIIDVLTRMGLELISHKEEVSRLKIPTFRIDLNEEIDLIEEIARIIGYDKIPERVLIDFLPQQISQVWDEERLYEQSLASLGLSEVRNYCFFSNKTIKEFMLSDDDYRSKCVSVKNPMSQDNMLVASFLIPNLIETAIRNMNQQNKEVRIFEINKVFYLENNEPIEKRVLAGILYQNEKSASWLSDNTQILSFYYIKGIMEAFLKLISINDFVLRKPMNPFSHPVESASVFVGDTLIGEYGKLHPLITKSFDFVNDLYYFEYSLNALSQFLYKEKKFISFSRFPSIKRDVSLLFDSSIEWQDIKTHIESLNKLHMENLSVFDVYQDEQIGKDKKNISFRITFRAMDKTLTDSDADTFRDEIINKLQTKFHASLRT